MNKRKESLPVAKPKSLIQTTDIVLHRLWTAHASGEYDKTEHKPLWVKLQKFVEQNGGLHK